MSTTVSFIDDENHVHEWVSLADTRAADIISFRSVRKISAHKGQRHLPGYYWFSSVDTLVPYESRLEMFTLLDLDFSGEVVGVLSQPLILQFRQGPRTVRHVPDFLLDKGGGALSLVDVKRRIQGERSDVRRVFEWTEGACSSLGWGYEVRHELDDVYLSNLKWLAGYRRRPPLCEVYGESLVDACSGGMPSIHELVSIAGSQLLIRPVLFHLLWRRVLAVDMTSLLSDESTVHLPGRG